MASRQQFKEDRAEAAAKLAAKDIGDINRAKERDEGYDLHNEANFKQARAEAAAKLAAKDLEDVNRLRSDSAWKEPRDDESKPGVIGSMVRAAKEAVVGKPHDAVDNSSRGVYDSAKEKARETKDEGGSKVGEYASQKAKETKDHAADKAMEAKDTTMQKAGEYKDYTAEKAKEGKDSAVGKLGELKDSAADAAKRAMGFFTAKKDETKLHVIVVQERVSGTKEETRRRMEEVRVQDMDYGAGRGGEKLVIKMEESRPGAMADALEAANKAMGDVEEEGVLHVERRREKM
ncbi:Embryonic protein DC-8 [Spatholobus suberectus]|nr:Embryonic protein DC-8 [Spatholobus suberectus]